MNDSFADIIIKNKIEIHNFEEQVKKQKTALKISQKENEDLKKNNNKIQTYEKLFSTQKNIITQLQEEISHLKEQEINKTLEQFKTNLTQLQQENQTLQSSLEQEQNKYNTLVTELSFFKSQQKQPETKYKKSNKDEYKNTTQNEEHAKILQKYEKSLAIIENQKKKLQTFYENPCVQHKAEITDLTCSIDIARDKNRLLEKDITELKNNIAIFKKQQSKDKAEIASLTLILKELPILKDEIKTLNKKITAKENQIKELTIAQELKNEQ